MSRNYAQWAETAAFHTDLSVATNLPEHRGLSGYTYCDGAWIACDPLPSDRLSYTVEVGNGSIQTGSYLEAQQWLWDNWSSE